MLLTTQALSAAHISLPKLMRAQMAEGAPDPTNLLGSLRAGKLVPSAVALQALRTALHAASEVLVLVEHAELHCTLEAIALALRPQLVLLLQPSRKSGGGGGGGLGCGGVFDSSAAVSGAAGAAGAGGAGGAGAVAHLGPPRWAEPPPGSADQPGSTDLPGSGSGDLSRTGRGGDLFGRSMALLGSFDPPGAMDLCAGPPGSGGGGAAVRHGYELRTLQALGEAAPPVCMCHGGLVEAARLVGECLRSEAAVDSDAARSPLTTHHSPFTLTLSQA